MKGSWTATHTLASLHPWIVRTTLGITDPLHWWVDGLACLGRTLPIYLFPTFALLFCVLPTC
uniref:Uncharacterized protein n=1 Tax=Picea glauca TaxID=3330 RepID=A0A117NG74_PICGL|nr:hypothetical protein ABT39_MTgene1859 [Picea glauca]